MFFSKPALPKPVRHWFLDQKSVERLREIISDPVFQTACATLYAAAQPAHAATLSRGLEQRAASFDWLAGYTDFLRDLEKLTRAPDTGLLPVDEWAHITHKP